VPGVEEVVERGADAADVQPAGRGRTEAHAGMRDGHEDLERRERGRRLGW
jgi:hypothetical protein